LWIEAWTAANFRSAYRAEPVPAEPNRLVTDIDTSFGQQVFNLSQRKPIPDVHHHREANDLGGTDERAEGFFHQWRLRAAIYHLKPFYFNSALREVKVGFL